MPQFRSETQAGTRRSPAKELLVPSTSLVVIPSEAEGSAVQGPEKHCKTGCSTPLRFPDDNQ